MTELAGKIAVISGGASGIGLATAMELARAGAHIVICDRDQKTLGSALAQVQSCGSAEANALDVRDKAFVASTVTDIALRHKRIDILVNSAGVNAERRRLDALSADAWDDVVSVNLSGTFYCCHAVMPSMRTQGGGVIVNISSWAGRYPAQFTGSAYNASKRAVIALTESINMEECNHGIRATAVLPEEVATPLLDRRPQPPSEKARARMLQPRDLARTIRFIATLPPSVCVNELTISPTWNRSFLGGFDAI